MISYLIIFSLIISFIYCLFILLVIFKFLSSRQEKVNAHRQQKGVSVIIPYRNEENNLLKLWQHISVQNYSEVEIIFVNDHSTDSSEQIVAALHHATFQIKKMNLPDGSQGKKEAIELGVKEALFDRIICLDADCFPVSENWISNMNSFDETIRLSGGPVYLEPSNNFWHLIQSVENYATQTVTYAMSKLHSPIAISGANMAYSKKFFEAMKPYSTNKKTASGDDIYFLQKVKRSGFKSNQEMDEEWAVLTPPSTFKNYFSQRVRWMRKGSSFGDISTILIGFLIFLSLLTFLFGAVYQIIMRELNTELLISMGVKMGIDFLLLFLVALKFKRTELILVFIPAFLFNIFAFCGVILLGWFIPIHWKNRKI